MNVDDCVLTVHFWLAYNPARTTIENLKRAGYNATLRGCSSVVERLLPKQDIVGSSPITRSKVPPIERASRNAAIWDHMAAFFPPETCARK
jgi:hypothetical protein